jgi:hypothetical protein
VSYPLLCAPTIFSNAVPSRLRKNETAVLEAAFAAVDDQVSLSLRGFPLSMTILNVVSVSIPQVN